MFYKDYYATQIMAEDNTINVKDLDLIDEAYDRVDVLVEILDKKGIISKKEYETKLNQFLDEKYSKN